MSDPPDSAFGHPTSFSDPLAIDEGHSTGYSAKPRTLAQTLDQNVIVGRSAVMVQLLADVRRFAQTDARMLVTGESGVGKELIALYIHKHSRRASRPFVAVNCAGMPETLLESELFGHVKGSFTGAYRDKAGKFELAHTGTLFLDEIGETTLRMQGLLLRVLETGELQKVGSDRITTRADTRVIAATNRDLVELIQKGLFREDLFYRLNVVRVLVPPLRERPEDIPLLVEFLVRRAARQAGVQCTVSSDFYDALRSYSWPGNVRQLDNLIQRLVISTPDGILRPTDIPRDMADVIMPLPIVRPQIDTSTLADRLYERLRAGGSFWDVVYTPYMRREITKTDVRAVVQKGLEAATGNYRVVTRMFNMELGEYTRFLNFLRKQGCLLPFREFRH